MIQGMEKPIGFNVILDPTEFATSLNREDADRRIVEWFRAHMK